MLSRQDRAEKLAKAEQRRQSGKGRRDFSNIVTPRIPDSEDDGNGRPALRLGRAPRLGPALTGSSASVRCRPAVHCMLSWRARARHMIVACCPGIMDSMTIM